MKRARVLLVHKRAIIMDWSKIPDFLAITSLVGAFSSILRRDRKFCAPDSSGSDLWLVGWCLISVHFVGFMFMNAPGIVGILSLLIGLVSLEAAAVFFMWATIPHRLEMSSRLMATTLLLTLSAYTVLQCLEGIPTWQNDIAAALIGLGPLAVTLAFRRLIANRIRWLVVCMQCTLGAALLFSHHIQTGIPGFGINAILFMVYMDCCLHFWYTHRRWTAGSFITVGGFFVWSMVFVAGPTLASLFPSLHIESEVWNLPKYVVAVGMLLLLLENQIERTQYLALHDDLTALANRRLFQDRLMNAMERARRAGTPMALLQIDLNRFKDVNDTFGHHMGDLLLQQVARRLDGRSRRSDTLARTGGDEFSLVMVEPTTRVDAELLAHLLEKMLEQPFNISGKRIEIGASVGVAVYPDDALDFESLCIAADDKMYERKRNLSPSHPIARTLDKSPRT